MIAEFMGFTDESKFIGGRNCMSKNTGPMTYVAYDFKDLKYHISWDWLMEVVEKIESLGFSVEVVKHICRINLSSDANIVVSENIPKLEATYQAVCQFIEWYNENK